MSRTSFASLLSLAVLACSGQDEPLPPADPAPPRTSAMPRLERRSLSLGAEDLAEQYFFPMTVGRDGAIVFAASREETPLWRIVDSSGRRVAAFGRSGDGPGEFREPLHLRVRNDTLEFRDSGRAKVIWYNWDGGFLGEAPSMVNGIRLAARGDSVDTWVPPAMTNHEAATIMRVPVSGLPGRVVVPERDSGFQAILAAPPGEQELMRLGYALGPDRIYLADAFNYRIFAYDTTGTLLAVFGRDLPPHRRGPRELGEVRARIRDQPRYTRGPNGEAIELPDRSGRLDTLQLEVTPHFDRDPLHVDPFSRLWVIGRTNDSTAVDLFENTEFVGRTMLPCYLTRVGSPVVLSWPWLLLECTLAEEDDMNTELQLYRIVER